MQEVDIPAGSEWRFELEEGEAMAIKVSVMFGASLDCFLLPTAARCLLFLLVSHPHDAKTDGADTHLLFRFACLPVICYCLYCSITVLFIKSSLVYAMLRMSGPAVQLVE
jgi:hypothetical protein